MQASELRRGLIVPVLVAVMGFSAFLRTEGAETVRNVQILSLVACGMGLGVALAHLKILLGMRAQK